MYQFDNFMQQLREIHVKHKQIQQFKQHSKREQTFSNKARR